MKGKQLRIWGLLGLLLFTACTERRIFEENTHLEEHSWHIDSVLSFSFEITDEQIPYDIYLNIRYAYTHPYYNLYLLSTLHHSPQRKVVHEELKTFTLFDPASGKPLGSGSTEIYFLQSPLWTQYRFPAAGKYTLEVRQYMRTTTLKDILDLGIRVEKSP